MKSGRYSKDKSLTRDASKFRHDWVQFRVNQSERDILERYAKMSGAGVGMFSTFYRELLVNLALKQLGQAESAGKGVTGDKSH